MAHRGLSADSLTFHLFCTTGEKGEKNPQDGPWENQKHPMYSGCPAGTRVSLLTSLSPSIFHFEDLNFQSAKQWTQVSFSIGTKFQHASKESPSRFTFRINLIWDYTFLFLCQLQIPKSTRIHLNSSAVFSLEECNRESSDLLGSWEFLSWRFGLVFIFLAAGPANMIQWRSYLILQRKAT